MCKKKELANQITRLETHVKQLQNIIKKQQKNEKHRKQEDGKKRDKEEENRGLTTQGNDAKKLKTVQDSDACRRQETGKKKKD
ncbi:Uncharacterised protein r2_g2901 [Pycnogonum litorale]